MAICPSNRTRKVTWNRNVIDAASGVNQTIVRRSRGSVNGEGVGLVRAQLVLDAAVAGGLTDASDLAEVIFLS